MSAFKSIVLTKDRAFYLKDTDSHQDIIEHFGLVESGVRGPNVVRLEITPPTHWNHQKKLNVRSWSFRIDQDELPEWAPSKESVRHRGFEALKEFAKRYIKPVRATKRTKHPKLKRDEYFTDYMLHGDVEVVRLVKVHRGSMDCLVKRPYGGHDGNGILSRSDREALKRKKLSHTNLWWVPRNLLVKDTSVLGDYLTPCWKIK